MNNSQTDLSPKELIERFSEIVEVTYEEADQLIGADTSDQILNNIEKYTKKKIYDQMPPLNRAQRRALKKKMKGNHKSTAQAPTKNEIDFIADTSQKLNYIDLIQKLRALNEKKEKENENYEGID